MLSYASFFSDGNFEGKSKNIIPNYLFRAVINNSSFLYENFIVKTKRSNLEIFFLNEKNTFDINPFYLMLLFKENYIQNIFIVGLKYFYDQRLINIISGRIINLVFLKNDFTFAYKNGAA